MNILQDIFSQQFIYALGWTLVHSLWQGALIGIIIALVIIFMYRYTARLRYFIYNISLFLFAGIAILTFVRSYANYDSDTAVSKVSSENIAIVEASGDPFMILADRSEDNSVISPWIHQLSSYCRTHIPFFVAIWLLGMLAMLLRFMGGYALVRRYRSQRIKPVRGAWDQRFDQLKKRIGLKKNVRLLESALVKVPMAIGYLKPVILIPLGALNGVPAEQMEAILVHELAHIKRRDYLMNMIQSVLEIIFFYHPVVWWLSKNIRIERENICDDIAITITGNTMEFAKALTNIQAIDLGAPGLAAGLSGKNKNRLLNRVRRLASKPKLHSGFTEGFIAASILVISLIGLSAAAMITYPADKLVDPKPVFTQASIEIPGYVQSIDNTMIPDTVEKKAQKAEQSAKSKEVFKKDDSSQITEEEMEKINAMEAELEAQMKVAEAQMKVQMEAAEAQMKAQMEAVEKELDKHNWEAANYQKANKDYQYVQQQYAKEMARAAEAYQEAMKQSQYQLQQHAWTIPELYANCDTMIVHGDDTLIWHYRKPNYAFVYSDSLKDLFSDVWVDTHMDMEDFYFDMEEHQHELEKQLKELKEVELLEHIYEPDNFFVEPNDFMEAPAFVAYENFGFSGRTRSIIEDELRDDDLIEHGREYLIVIGKKQMIINGEKQSRAVFKKYRRLVDSAEESWFVDDEDEFKIYINH